LNIPDLNTDRNAGIVFIQANSIALTAVTVQASQVIAKDDRYLIIPTEMQKKASSNGLNLLRNLQLPNIYINPVKNSIESLQEGNVLVYLNGIPSSTDEITALTPSEIIRIEYHDAPGIKYKNAATVIDFITRQRVSGGNVSTSLQNALSDVAVSYNLLSAKYNCKKSEFGFLGSYSRTKVFWYYENEDAFLFPDREIHRTETPIGEPSRFLDDKVNFALNYNLREPDKYLLNVKLKNNFTDIPSDFMDRTAVVHYSDSNNPLFVSEHSAERTNTPSIDIYYQHNLKNKQLLIFNLVATYIHTKNSRRYTEKAEQETLSNIYSFIEGKKNSLIVEGIYEKKFDKGTLSGSLNHFQSHSQNNYTGNITSSVSLDFAETHASLEYRFSKNKFNYVFGVGGTRTFNRQKYKKRTHCIFRPKISITYRIDKDFNIRYEANISNQLPSLSDMNEIEQTIDSFQIKRGNPDLYTTPSYNNKMTLFFNQGLVTANFTAGYNYVNRPIMENVLFENNKFIKMMENQKNSRQLFMHLGLKVRPVQYITLSLSPGYWYYISSGRNYLHTLTNWHLNASVLANYKKWSFYADARTRRNTLKGEVINYGERLHTLSVNYSANQWSLGLSMINPFTREYSQYSRNFSRLTPSHTKIATNSLGQILLLHFSWNLNWGVKYESGSRKINNEDTDSGIMTGKGEKPSF
jgi:hypothetical protein